MSAGPSSRSRCERLCLLVACDGEVGGSRTGANARRCVRAHAHCLCASRGREDELALEEVHMNVVSRVELALKDLFRQAVLDLALDRTTQRPRSERRVEADLNEVL